VLQPSAAGVESKLLQTDRLVYEVAALSEEAVRCFPYRSDPAQLLSSESALLSIDDPCDELEALDNKRRSRDS
jgi:hypothetical protein